MRLLALVAALATILAGLAAPAAAEAGPAAVGYQPPVDAPVLDRFRPPASPYGPGNRGVDYATTAGTPVAAAAPGEVVFAGPVADSLHVVVLHADGIRTSYSFLAEVAVRRGDRVEAGAVVGLAGGPLHFGARAGDAYLDPLALLDGPPQVFLVPDDLRRPLGEAGERSRLERFLRWLPRAAAAAGAAGVSWARAGAAAAVDHVRTEASDTIEELRGWAHYLELANGTLEVRLTVHLARRWAARGDCTPADVPPPRIGERRLAVLVGGLGSASGRAAVLDVDTAALGYAAGDVVQFSYRGGTTADTGYGPADTQVDIDWSGRRLRALLERLQAEHPGVPIDVIAHSQGGLVARAALRAGLDPHDPRTPQVRNLVTLGTPHHGADLATAGFMISRSPLGGKAAEVASVVRPAGIDPGSVSVRQMAETSGFIRALNRDPLPRGVRVTSIAARTDLVVPAPRSHLEGATNVVVGSGGGAFAHDALPGSVEARRELALALAGRAPTCESTADLVADVVTGAILSRAEDAAGAALSYAGRRGGLR